LRTFVSILISQRYCDGKCFLAEKIKAAKDQRDAIPALSFSQDFGVYITTFIAQLTHPSQETILTEHHTFYTFHLGRVNTYEIDHPPQADFF
jgi:hypothetical protein